MRDSESGDSAPATVTVAAKAANQPPAANNQAVTVTIGTMTVIDLDATDADGPPPPPLTIVEPTFSDPSGVVTNRTGLRLSILAPTPGTFMVTYQVTDGEATSATATLTITALAPAATTTATTTTSAATATTTTTTTPP